MLTNLCGKPNHSRLRPEIIATLLSVFLSSLLSALVIFSIPSLAQTGDIDKDLKSPVRFTQGNLKATVKADPNCFTQGLKIHTNELWVSCGQYKNSKLIRYRIVRNKDALIKLELKQEVPFSFQIFLEGISVNPNNHQWLVLTWKNQLAFSFDSKKHQPINAKSVNLKGEGWGVEYNNTSDHWILSDGSDELQIIDNNIDESKKLKLAINQNSSKIKIKDFKKNPIQKINELEFIGRDLWFNQWQSDQIYFIQDFSINKSIQHATAIDLSHISMRHKNQGVLNGIAYDKSHKELWITGKNWGSIYIFNYRD